MKDYTKVFQPKESVVPPLGKKPAPRNIKKSAFAFYFMVVIFICISVFVGGYLEQQNPDLNATPQQNSYSISDSEIATIHMYADPRHSKQRAYKMTNVIRTAYNPNSTSASREEAVYLGRLFRLTDLLVSERVEKQLGAIQGKPMGSMENYYLAVDEIAGLAPPERLQEIHALIAEATKIEADYFTKIKREEIKFDVNSNQVQKAHANLYEAYLQLLRTYPHESANNKTSFYSHLCALDFI